MSCLSHRIRFVRGCVTCCFVHKILVCAMLWRILLVTWRTFDGPFSAVSRPRIARVGAFCSIFRDLQILHVVRAFAPLKTQIFCKMSSFFLDFLQLLLFIVLKPIFWRIFWRILTKFWRTVTNFDELWRNLTKFYFKIRQKFVKKWRMNSSVRHFWVTNCSSSTS